MKKSQENKQTKNFFKREEIGLSNENKGKRTQIMILLTIMLLYNNIFKIQNRLIKKRLQ